MKQRSQRNLLKATEMLPTDTGLYFVSKSVREPKGEFNYNEEITRRILETPSQRRTANEKTAQRLIIPECQDDFGINRPTYLSSLKEYTRGRETPLYQKVKVLLSWDLSSPDNLKQLQHHYRPNDIAFFQILQKQFANQNISKEEQVLRGLNHFSPVTYESHTVTIYRPNQLETQDERVALLTRDSKAYHREDITMFCPKGALSTQQQKDIADLFAGNCSQFRVSMVKENGTEVSARLSHPVPENRIQSKDENLIGPELKSAYGHIPSSIYTYENGEYLSLQTQEPREYEYGAFRGESWGQYLITQTEEKTGKPKLLYNYGNVKPGWKNIKQELEYLANVKNDGKAEIQVQKITLNPQDIFQVSKQNPNGIIVHLPDSQGIDPTERMNTLEQISISDIRQSHPQTHWVLLSHDIRWDDPFSTRVPIQEWTKQPTPEEIQKAIVQVMKEDDAHNSYNPFLELSEERRQNTDYVMYQVQYDPQYEQIGMADQAGMIVSKFNPEYVHQSYVGNQNPVWKLHHEDAYALQQSVREGQKKLNSKDVQFAGEDKATAKSQAVKKSQDKSGLDQHKSRKEKKL